jgi:hypothetical protein
VRGIPGDRPMDDARVCHACSQLAALQTALLIFAGYHLLSMWYHGEPMAELPFEPISLLTRITHRGVEGDRMHEVGVVRSIHPWSFFTDSCRHVGSSQFRIAAE